VYTVINSYENGSLYLLKPDTVTRTVTHSPTLFLFCRRHLAETMVAVDIDTGVFTSNDAASASTGTGDDGTLEGLEGGGGGQGLGGGEGKGGNGSDGGGGRRQQGGLTLACSKGGVFLGSLEAAFTFRRFSF
jgi:hypothetical protein